MGRRHHQVSEFYLKYFAAQDPPGSRYLWVYDKKEPAKARRQTPQNTMVERGFYSLETKAGISDQLETLHAEAETLASPLFARLQHHEAILDHRDIALLAQFLALLYLRVPKTRDAMIEFSQIWALETLRTLSRRPDLLRRFLENHPRELNDHPVDEKELAAIFLNAEHNFRVVVDPKAALRDCFKPIGDIAELLYRMSWVVCDAPANAHFVTSDAPVCAFLPTGPGAAVLGAGFARPQVQVSFAVSPRVLLLIDWQHTQQDRTRCSVRKTFVDEMNERMVWNAQRFVISSRRDPFVQQLVHRAKITLSRPKLERRILGALASAAIQGVIDKL